MSFVLWLRTRVPWADCMSGPISMSEDVPCHLHIPSSDSPLGLALPPDPLGPHLMSLPQGGLLGLAITQSKPAWFALSQKCASLNSPKSLLKVGSVCCKVLRSTKDCCSWVLKCLVEDLDCLWLTKEAVSSRLCLKGLALQRSESLC